MILYIQYFTALPQGKTKYHGGGNYTKNIVRALSKIERKDLKIILIIQTNMKFCVDEYPDLSELLTLNNVDYKVINSINEIVFKNDDILFYPMIGYLYEFQEVVKVREKNPKIKICATLHDIRFYNYTYDYSVKYYVEKKKRWYYPFGVFFKHIIMKIIMQRALKRCFDAIDEIYTDSNYSMQQILNINRSIKINPYYLNVYSKEPCKCLIKENYILFVSGSRPLKNLAHALIAFSMYKEEVDSDTLLVITGIDRNLLDKLYAIPKVNGKLIDQYIVVMGYVSEEELASLYINCDYLVYISKCEGFGLPVLEAAIYGKTTIASNTTSVPEVLGAAVRYVNPIDDNAIKEEMKNLGDERIRKKYEKRINLSMQYLKQRMLIEQDFFLQDLLS